MTVTAYEDLPGGLPLIGYAHSPFTSELTFSESVDSWGAITAVVYTSREDRTVLFALTVDDPSSTVRTFAADLDDMEDLLGTEQLQGVGWWEATRAVDGEVFLAGPFVSTRRVAGSSNAAVEITVQSITISISGDGASALAAHLADTVGAHAATAISDRGRTVHATLTALRATIWRHFGHSYAWLYGTPSQRGVQRVAEQCGATFENWAVTGSEWLASGATQGGFASLFHDLDHPGNTYSGGAGFPPGLGLVSIMTGHNDLVSYGSNESGLRAAWRHAFRASLAWCHASAFFQWDEASTGQTLGGAGWATTTTSDITPGTSYRASSTTGVTVTVATPANAAGKTVALVFVADYVGASIPASAITFTRDGQAATATGYAAGFSTIDAWPSVVGNAGVMVARFTLPDDAATHSIVATAGAGGMAYAGWLVESPRPVLVVDVARTTLGTTTDAQVALLNTDLATVVAESHTDQTKIVGMDAALAKASNVFGDGVHPNVRGQRLLADAVFDILGSLSLDDDEAVLV